MQPTQAARFRLIMQILEPYFQKGELYLLHCNYGYLVFTSKRLHQVYGHVGNGQWQEIPDLFYFTLSYDAEDKDTLEEKGIELEMWIYTDTATRSAWSEKISGKAGLGLIYRKKGFDLIYKKEILPLEERPEDYYANSEKLIVTIQRFLAEELPEIENAILA
ncbi:MAG: hypothetical protein J6328_04315 [Bacilli bacterium]|nr:hypothetical protein [Bacilli bacterium]